MKIKMLVSSAGPAGVRNEGGVYDVDEREAKELVAGGYALEALDAPAKAGEPEGWSGDGAERIAELEEQVASLEEKLAKKATDKVKEAEAQAAAAEAEVVDLKARIAQLEAEVAGLTGGAEGEGEGDDPPASETATDPAAAGAEQATAPPQS